MVLPAATTFVHVGSPDAQDAGEQQKSADKEKSADEEKKQDRRLQNKRNQRARRLRLKEQRAAAETEGPNRRPYCIMRWRLGTEPHPGRTHAPPSQPEAAVSTVTKASSHRETPAPRGCTISPRDKDIAKGLKVLTLANPHQNIFFPLPADHLLHLIQFNVTRALTSNKNTVQALSMYATLQHPDPVSCVSLEVRAITQRGRPDGQTSLSATQLQMSRQHSPWIGMLPWPRVRDNLIERHTHFDHWEFLLNLVGEELHGANVDNDDIDEVTSGRQGLIVWGEPHDPAGWEVTPGFLGKWTWVFEGCSEVLDVSNRWRVLRGAEPLRMSVTE